VAGIDGARDVTGGGMHTCVRRQSGDAVCWGENGAGQLGDGATAFLAVPTAVAGL
jgi:hypothetical protein